MSTQEAYEPLDPRYATPQDPKRYHRLALVILGELSCFLYAGIIFGWSPLLDIFKDMGVYADKCAAGDPWCEDQQSALSMIYTYGSVMQTGCTIFVGLFMDKVGLRPLLVLGCVAEIAGLWLLMGYNSPIMFSGIDPTLCLTLGALFTAFGSMCFFQHGFSLAGLYPGDERKTTLIVALACTLFDASSLIFVLVKFAHSAGIALHTCGIVLIVLCIILTISMVWLRTVLQPVPTENEEPAFEQLADTEEDAATGLLLSHKPFGLAQLLTLEFAFVIMYMTVHMTRSNMYLGMLTPFFESINGENSTTDTIVQVATLMVPAGALFTPLVEIIIDRTRGAGGALLVHILGAVYGAMMFIRSPLWIQVLTTVVYGFYRALLFSVIAAFNLHVFGYASLGRINGVMYSSTGLVSLIITPAMDYAQDDCDGDYKWLLIFQFIAMVPSLALNLLMYFYSREPFVGGPRMLHLEQAADEDEQTKVRPARQLLLRTASTDVAECATPKSIRNRGKWFMGKPMATSAPVKHVVEATASAPVKHDTEVAALCQVAASAPAWPT